MAAFSLGADPQASTNPLIRVLTQCVVLRFLHITTLNCTGKQVEKESESDESLCVGGAAQSSQLHGPEGETGVPWKVVVRRFSLWWTLKGHNLKDSRCVLEHKPRSQSDWGLLSLGELGRASPQAAHARN